MYEGTVDLENTNNSHTFAVQMIGGNKRVLEFGCASGFVTRALVDHGCRVVSIEIDPDFASQAKEFCEDVIVGDAESLDLESVLSGQTFDVALFGDVLEHMKDPLAMLRRTRAWLAPEGFVVASLPNVAHGAVRLALLQGRFDYRPEGLLDDTHLRFFTHDSVKEMLRQAGFALVETRRTVLGVFDTEIPLRPEDFSAEVLRDIEADPDATTYQFVVKALVDNSFTAAIEAHEREEEQRLELLRVTRELETLRDESAALRAALAEAEEGRHRQDLALASVGEEVDDLRRRLAAKEDQLAHHEAHWQAFEQKGAVRLYRRLRRITGGP